MKHTFRMAQWAETTHHDHMEGDSPSTVGEIMIQPPISVGPGFNSSVLGPHHYGQVSLTHVITTPERTVFIAESHREGTDNLDRQDDIALIAHRIIRLAGVDEFGNSEALPMSEEPASFAQPHKGDVVA